MIPEGCHASRCSFVTSRLLRGPAVLDWATEHVWYPNADTDGAEHPRTATTRALDASDRPCSSVGSRARSGRRGMRRSRLNVGARSRSRPTPGAIPRTTLTRRLRRFDVIKEGEVHPGVAYCRSGRPGRAEGRPEGIPGQVPSGIQCGYAGTCHRGSPRLMPRAREAVVIGAGPNGLVAANLLAVAGWDVLLEAQARGRRAAVKSDSERGRRLRPRHLQQLLSDGCSVAGDQETPPRTARPDLAARTGRSRPPAARRRLGAAAERRGGDRPGAGVGRGPGRAGVA